MPQDTNRPTAALPLFRYAATAVAVGRVALGVVALTKPSVPARPWVGASADELGAEVFGRALGARDLALGLGALAAIRKSPSDPWSEGAWYAAGALSDACDVAITAAAWPRLPRTTRWLIAAAAGGAAIAGAAGALAALGVGHQWPFDSGRRVRPADRTAATSPITRGISHFHDIMV